MSLLLDTNVVSELLRPSPNPTVESWAAEHQASELYFSAVDEAEFRYGVAKLPSSQRKDGSSRRLRDFCERTSRTSASKSSVPGPDRERNKRSFRAGQD